MYSYRSKESSGVIVIREDESAHFHDGSKWSEIKTCLSQLTKSNAGTTMALTCKNRLTTMEGPNSNVFAEFNPSTPSFIQQKDINTIAIDATGTPIIIVQQAIFKWSPERNTWEKLAQFDERDGFESVETAANGDMYATTNKKV